MKTRVADADVSKNRKWVLIDADGLVVGRLASFIVDLLIAKDSPQYTPFLDCGSKVVIINAQRVKFTGKKFTNKVYYRHTGYPGGIKETTPRFMTEKGFGRRILEKAVFGMMKGGPLSRKQMKNLYIYNDATHPHDGQQPLKIDFASLNKKNIA